MNDKPTINPKTLPPLTRFIYTLGQLPTSYLMSMSFEEQLVWLCNYLGTQVIPAVNQNGEAVEELQTLYELLRTYVNDYFDNLDVQDEINNKIDEMVQNGELLNMIKGYIDPFINEQNSKITHIENKVDAVATGSPLVASSVSEMTDTNRVYVLTTDGNWYYYNGTNWVSGGIYQATGDSENYIYQTKLTNFGNYESNKFIDYTNGNTYNYNNNYASDYIEVMKGSKIIIENFTTINADKRGLAFYDENKTFISGVQYPSNSSGIEAITPQNAKYLRFTFYVTNETTIVKIIFKNEILISNLLNSSIKINFDVTTKIKEHEYNRAFVSKNNGTLQIYINTPRKAAFSMLWQSSLSIIR